MTVRTSEASGETASLPCAIGSSTPSGASSASPSTIRRAASGQPRARSALMPGERPQIRRALTQGTSSGRSVIQATTARCATRRTPPAARMRIAALPPFEP